MRLRILHSALEDLDQGRRFYERQAAGLGAFFLDSLFAEIDSLVLYTGIHGKYSQSIAMTAPSAQRTSGPSGSPSNGDLSSFHWQGTCL